MEFTKDIQFNNIPTVNQYVKLSYNGFLRDSEELSIVYGFGESWEHTSETKMKKTSNGFVVKVNLLDFDTFNFCFRNSYNQWDNNCNCNYISPILPCDHNKVQLLFDELLTPYEQPKIVEKFDIDALIEEMLQPIFTKKEQSVEDITSVQINTQPVDLGVEVTKILSQIDDDTPMQEFVEYSSLDEILAGTVIEENPIDLFEEKSIDNIVDELIQNTKENSKMLENISIKNNVSSTNDEKKPSITKEQFAYYSQINSEITNIIHEIENTEKINEENALALIETRKSFVISPRQLSKFYLFRKRVKLAFYKAFVKLPKLIFGSQEQ